jgi:hypothetical protein
MNIALWICQWSLAGVFAFSGLVKGTQSKQRIIALGQTGVEFLPAPVIRFVAVAELAGALAVVAPWGTGITPALTPAAAVGLGVIMPLGRRDAHQVERTPQRRRQHVAVRGLYLRCGRAVRRPDALRGCRDAGTDRQRLRGLGTTHGAGTQRRRS